MDKIYIVYEKYKNKYYKTLQRYNDILDEKERLFLITQPKSIPFNKINVEGGIKNDIFQEYLIKADEKNFEKRTKETELLLIKRKKLLNIKEKELRESKEWIDKLYVYKYLENLKIKKILNLIPYSESQIYRMLGEIEKNKKMIR